jgi:3-oxoacyl-[acyl-carrier protein] reductase
MANRYDLEGKFAIVTGGARGIGAAIVQRLVGGGATVEVWDLAPPAAFAGVRGATVDVTNPASIAAALQAIPADRRIDVLVNDAGYLGAAQAYAAHDVSDWQRIVDVNLLGTMRVTQAVLPRMIAQGGGRIVNLGSLAGREGLPTLAAYSAASGGIVAFSKALGREVVGQGVLVNCVAPGPIDTDMIRALGDDAVARMIADSPMRRLGNADEVAQIVAWLCTDAASLNAGSVFDASGGRARA